MPDDILREIACPNCRNPIDVREYGRHLSCDACGSQFLLQGHICPSCFAYHREDTLFCGECGTPLQRTCRRCQANNWAGHEYCQQCGAAMDIFDAVMLQNKATARKAQEERQAQIKQLKKQEGEASARRMQELMEVEAQRLSEFQARKQKQAQRDRQMLVAIALLLALATLILALLTLLR